MSRAWAMILLAAFALILPALLRMPLTEAKPAVDPQLVYAELGGTMAAGLAAGGLDDVNHARVAFFTDDCHRDLRFHLDFSPTETRLDAGAASVAVPNQFELRLSDAGSGQPLANATFTWLAPGAHAYRLGGPSSLLADVFLRRGQNVTFFLRISGWADPEAECAWQGWVFINEVEANPTGADAGNESIEIYNAAAMPANLSGWAIHALHGTPMSLMLPPGTSVAAGGRLVVEFTEGQFLDNQEEEVVLVAPGGWEVDRTPVLNDTANDDRTQQRRSDGADSWEFRASTLSAAN